MMKDLHEFEKLLNSIDKDTILKSKDLVILGINNYYIKKLVDADILEVVSRGNYKYKGKNEERELTQRKFELFHIFKTKVLEEKYEEAYEFLMKNYHVQTTHNYDNHMRIYFIFLKELLNDNYDFSVLDELLEFAESSVIEGYYAYFVSFRECVMSGNYYEAVSFLDKFKNAENDALGYNNISTILFDKMLNDVIKRKELNDNKEYEKQEYLLFKTEFGKDNFEDALKHLENSITYSTDEKSIQRKKQLKKILKKIIELNNSDIELKDEEIYYSEDADCFKILFWSINNSDFLKSLSVLDECIKQNETKYLLVIKRMLYKLSEINRRNADRKKVDNQQEIKNMANISYNSYIAFEYYFKNGDYKAALDNLIKSNETNMVEKYKLNNQRLISLLEKIIVMQENGEILEDKVFYYPAYEKPIYLLNAALDNKDFLTAFKNIGKCTYQSESKILLLMKSMLHIIYNLDKENKKNNNIVNIPISQKGEQKIEEVTPKLIEQGAVKEINDSEVYEYVYNRNYDELKEILKNEKRNHDLSRTKNYTLKLLLSLEDIKNNSFFVGNYEYQSDSFDYYRRIYEALKYKDYEEAKNAIDNVFERASNQLELNIYYMLIEDILFEKEKLEKKETNLELDKEYEKKILTFIGYKNSLEENELDELISLFNNKVSNLEEISEYPKYDYISLQILDVIRDINRFNITANYFETMEYDKLTKEEMLIKALENGDYVTAFKIIVTTDFNKELSGIPFNKLLIIKKLLVIFNVSINKKIVVEKIDDEEIKIDDKLINNLSTLKKMIKKRDFYGAFYYYILNDFKDLGEELPALLAMLYDYQLSEKREYFERYLSILGTKNYEAARRKLDQFKEYISMSSLNRNIDYHYKRLESTIVYDSSDKELKDFLYNDAVQNYKKNNYYQALDSIERYIELDKDVTARGYLMRGRLYESLRDHDRALEDYMRAVEIIPEPNALYRIAKYYIRECEYDKAIYYLNEFISRRPTKDGKAYRDLANIYGIINKKEEQIKYKNLSDILYSSYPKK